MHDFYEYHDIEIRVSVYSRIWPTPLPKRTSGWRRQRPWSWRNWRTRTSSSSKHGVSLYADMLEYQLVAPIWFSDWPFTSNYRPVTMVTVSLVCQCIAVQGVPSYCQDWGWDSFLALYHILPLIYLWYFFVFRQIPYGLALATEIWPRNQCCFLHFIELYCDRQRGKQAAHYPNQEAGTRSGPPACYFRASHVTDPVGRLGGSRDPTGNTAVASFAWFYLKLIRWIGIKPVIYSLSFADFIMFFCYVE